MQKKGVKMNKPCVSLYLADDMWQAVSIGIRTAVGDADYLNNLTPDLI